MKRFALTQAVKFSSLVSDHVFHGRVVGRLGTDHYLVEDNSGLKPRPVKASRLEFDVAGGIFIPKVAA